MRKRFSIFCLLFYACLVPLKAEPLPADCRFVLTLPHQVLYEIDIEISKQGGHWREVYHKPMTDEILPQTVHEGTVPRPEVQDVARRVRKVCWATNHPPPVEYADTPAGCLFADENGFLVTDATRVCRDPELRGLALATFGLLRKAQLITLIARLKQSGPEYACLIPLLEQIARAKRA